MSWSSVPSEILKKTLCKQKVITKVIALCVPGLEAILAWHCLPFWHRGSFCWKTKEVEFFLKRDFFFGKLFLSPNIGAAWYLCSLLLLSTFIDERTNSCILCFCILLVFHFPVADNKLKIKWFCLMYRAWFICSESAGCFAYNCIAFSGIKDVNPLYGHAWSPLRALYPARASIPKRTCRDLMQHVSRWMDEWMDGWVAILEATAELWENVWLIEGPGKPQLRSQHISTL